MGEPHRCVVGQLSGSAGVGRHPFGQLRLDPDGVIGCGSSVAARPAAASSIAGSSANIKFGQLDFARTTVTDPADGGGEGGADSVR